MLSCRERIEALAIDRTAMICPRAALLFGRGNRIAQKETRGRHLVPLGLRMRSSTRRWEYMPGDFEGAHRGRKRLLKGRLFQLSCVAIESRGVAQKIMNGRIVFERRCEITGLGGFCPEFPDLLRYPTLCHHSTYSHCHTHHCAISSLPPSLLSDHCEKAPLVAITQQQQRACGKWVAYLVGIAIPDGISPSIGKRTL